MIYDIGMKGNSMKINTDKMHASLRIAFQTNRPATPGAPRQFRELRGTARMVYLSDAKDVESVARVIQEAVDSAIQKLKEPEEAMEIP